MTKTNSTKGRSQIMLRHGGIYFVTTSDFGKGHVGNAKAALDGGVRIIQYRNKDGEIRDMVDDALKIKRLCKSRGAVFLIDDRVDLALAVDADGVHLGQEDMPLKIARKIFPDKIIGISAKTPRQAIEAQRDGADYIGAGAVFPTQTKVKTQIIGMDGLKAVRKAVKIPVYGIGGLKLEHVEKIKACGADGMAVITAIADAKDMKRAASELVKAWKE